MKLSKSLLSHPKMTHLYLFLAFIFIVSLFNITSVIAKEKPVKKKSKYVSECISLIEGRPGNHIFGAIKNTCRFPINYTYCIEDPREPVISVKDCKRELLEVEIEVKAKQTVGAEVDRGGKVYYFACRSPSEPSQLEYVQGKGIRGICTGEKDEAETSKEPSSTQTKKNKSSSRSSDQESAEESTTVTPKKSEDNNAKNSCLNEDLLEKYAQGKYRKEVYYKRATMTKDGYKQDIVENDFNFYVGKDLNNADIDHSIKYYNYDIASYRAGETSQENYLSGPRAEFMVYTIECLRSQK